MPTIVGFVVLGYLLGSVPFAYLVARLRGVNIFRVGSGNPGTANVFLQVGRRSGLAVFLGDSAKGAAAFLLPRLTGEAQWVSLAAGAAAMVGHWAPVFAHFRGGGGLATAAGVALAALSWAGLVGVAVALAVLALVRRNGPAAAAGYVAAGPAAVWMGMPTAFVLGILMLPAAVLIHLTVLHQSERSRRRVLMDGIGTPTPLPASPHDAGQRAEGPGS